MDVTSALLRFASGRPHVLLLETPGGTAARLAGESELRRRGWPVAASPAEADIVVLIGPFDAQLVPMVGRVWRQLPKPRVFLHADSAAAVSSLLDEGRSRLAAGGESWEEFAGEEHEDDAFHAGQHGGEQDGDSGREPEDTGDGDPEGGRGCAGEQDGGHENGDEGGHDHGDESDHEHGGESGHDHVGGHDHHHHGAGMQMPGGLGMADRGPDRDGLRLDQLHVPLGPLLAAWPPGLVVHTTLQGDVLQQVRVDVLGEHGAGQDFWEEPRRWAAAGREVTRGAAARRRGAAYLDGLARLLRVAGWSDPAVGTARLRDELLAGARGEQVTPRLRRVARQLRRARTLRWLTDGIGVLPPDRAEAAGFGGVVLRASRSGGDVTARWLAWLAEVERIAAQVDDTTALPAEEVVPQGDSGARGRSVPALAVLPELLQGVELAAARLIVASLDPAVTALDGRVSPGGADG